MARIGIDIRCLTEGRRTGVEEYALSLMRSLFDVDNQNSYILFLNSFRLPKADLEWIKKYPNVELKKLSWPNKILNLTLWYFDWPKLDNLIGGADVFFMPNIIFGSVSSKAKLVLTVHDLSFERYPETFSWKKRFWHGFINPKRLIGRADAIIAVSDSTKNDLISLYDADTESRRIKVVSSGISEKFRIIDRNDESLIKVKEKYRLPYKFILYFGTIEPRKNIISIIKAFEQLHKFAQSDDHTELQKYKLVIAGHKGWLGEGIYEAVNKSQLSDNIIIIHSLPDEDKEYLMNLASLFVYPSLFEGFGFPPLEAMKCGIPVITANNSSLPEIVGDAGVMIDPDRPDELWQAMREILTSRELYDKLRERGLKRAEQFFWEKAAREFLKIIKSLS